RGGFTDFSSVEVHGVGDHDVVQRYGGTVGKPSLDDGRIDRLLLNAQSGPAHNGVGDPHLFQGTLDDPLDPDDHVGIDGRADEVGILQGALHGLVDRVPDPHQGDLSGVQGGVVRGHPVPHQESSESVDLYDQNSTGGELVHGAV